MSPTVRLGSERERRNCKLNFQLNFLAMRGSLLSPENRNFLTDLIKEQNKDEYNELFVIDGLDSE